MRIDRCRWIRPRLPLLAGGELGPEERRRVERHLIGCPDCREGRASMEGALSALRSAALEPAPTVDDRPIWPALARQIRESRHLPPRSWFSWPSPDLSRLRLDSGLWPALGLALGLGGVMVGAIARGREIARTAPSPPVEAVAIEPEIPFASRGTTPPPVGPSRPAPSSKPGVNPFEPPPTLRFDYDLERGTPIGPGNRDPQHSY